MEKDKNKDKAKDTTRTEKLDVIFFKSTSSSKSIVRRLTIL